MRAFGVLVIVALASACGGPMLADATRATLRMPMGAAADPTLRPARLVPLRSPDDEKNFGVEAGGGKRMLIAGVRVIKLANGGIQSATDPLPSPPSATVELPERLGGGFLFALGPVIWRADKWLAPLKMLYASPLAPTQVFVGLDRAYLRLQNNAYVAFDARTGAPMDLGPWPASPDVSRYVAADGWRAVAIADMRGAIATFDAGSKWQSLALPIQPTELKLVGDAIVVTGTDVENTSQSYAVQPNGQIAHLSAQDVRIAHVNKTREDPEQAAKKNPLLAAVIDGWPLSDGSALVARDGALTRVRMADGATLDTAPDAFPLKPARCHPISLAPDKAPGAFGFVCGEQHGVTEIYAYEPSGKLRTLRHFDGPRAVFSPGNGTLVVEGACATDAIAVDIKKTEQSYCIMRKGGAFEDFVVNGDVGTERVVPLADGRTAIISPPAGDLATARLTIFDGAKPSTIPIIFDGATPPKPKLRAKHHDDDDDDDDDDRAPSLDDDTVTAAVLRSGTWLRGVEERTPGVLSVWVEHSGRYVGVEIGVGKTAPNLLGHAKHGPFIAELGTAVVSSRYGLGWTASRQGYETTDGGMTWKPLTLPEPLESAGPAAGSPSHGCGPLGCVLAGWIRVGWGAPEDTQSSAYTSSTPHSIVIPSPTSLSIRCELAGKLAIAGNDTASSHGNDGYNYGYRNGYRAPVTQDWKPFYTVEAPKLGTDDLGLSRRTDDFYDRVGNDHNNAGNIGLGSALARTYSWGPKGIDWDLRGHTMVRFTSPFESSSALHATQQTATPRFVADSWNYSGTGGAIAHPIQMVAFIPGDDGSHALLVLRRAASYRYYANQPPQPGDDMILLELEADRPAIEVHRIDSLPLGDLESAVRIAGRWYLATSETSPLTTAIWEVESGVAREVVRIPRTASGAARPAAVRLAKSADGRMLGALLDASPMTEDASIPNRWLAQTWALPIDVETGALHEPERLGPFDGSGKITGVCAPENGGWITDGRWPGGTIRVLAASGAQLGYSSNGMLTRYRISAKTLCVEKLSLSGYGDLATVGKISTTANEGPFADASVFIDRARQAFRCVASH